MADLLRDFDRVDEIDIEKPEVRFLLAHRDPRIRRQGLPGRRRRTTAHSAQGVLGATPILIAKSGAKGEAYARNGLRTNDLWGGVE